MAQGELKLGERVIVSSSQGSKAGTLRYIGVTEFAPGQWCGVELDDPIGKNDGSVEGKRLNLQTNLIVSISRYIKYFVYIDILSVHQDLAYLHQPQKYPDHHQAEGPARVPFTEEVPPQIL